MNESLNILSERLDLIPMTPEFFLLSLDRDAAAAEEMLDLSIPDHWYERCSLHMLRIKQLMSEAAYQPWSLRAIGLREG